MSLTSANYNVTGNPSITSNFILTPTDENSYVTSSVATPTNSEFDIYTKVTAIDLQGVVGTGIMSILMSSNPTTSVSVLTQFRYPGIFTAISNIEGTQESTDTYGPSISANTDYWIRLHVSSPATHKLTLYAIADNNYTRDTLPNTGWYVSQDIDVSSSIYAGHNVRIGWGTLVSEINPASISIDLKETFISVQGNVVWEAVQTISPLNNKGYTNYTIIGDPTYNDGVYSDFRHDRYLQFPQDLKGTDKTYIVKFTTGSTVEGRQFIVNNYKFFTLCLDENYVCLFDWADSLVVNHLFAPAVNTTYYVKAAYNGLTVTVSHSMDGTSWVQDLQYTYSELVTSKDQYGFSVGCHPVWSTSPFRGSIDLNDFYVLDTATQNVLWMPSTRPSGPMANYNVTGSPTISSDFIVSGFSSGNYLTIPSSVDPTSASSWEFITKVTVASTNDYQKIIYGSGINFGIGQNWLHIWLSSNGGSTWFADNAIIGASNINNKWIKLAYTGSGYYIASSADGENYTTHWTTSTSTKIGSLSTIELGNHDSEYWRGSLDLKETLFNINGVEAWRAVEYVQGTPDYGSISISDGYYNNGVKTIQMPSQTIQASSLKNGQIPGNRTKAYAVSSSGVASVKLVGNDATEQALKGTYDVYAALDQPVYLSHAENYLTSGDAGDISQTEFSYIPGGESLNCTVVGSPTIDENFVVSNFSPSNYVTTTTPTVTSTFDMIARHVLPASAIKNGTYPDSLSFSGGDIGFGLNITGSNFTPVLYFTSSSSTTTTYYRNTTLWTWLKMTTTTCELYVLEDSTNQYTLDTLPAISSWTRKCYYSGSTNRLSYVSGKTLYFGINNANSNASANWTIDLKNSKYVADGVEWRGASTSPASVTIPKTFWYDSTGHNSYWYPQSVTVALADAKAEQTVGDVNRVFVTNELGQDLSVITLAEEEVVGDYTTSSLVPFYNAYLDHDTNNFILGLQKDPDEIVVRDVGGYDTGYTVEGSVSITGDFAASAFSGSNYITLPETIRSTDTSWEIGFAFATGSVSTGQYIYGCTNNNNSLLVGVESSKLRLYLSSNGSSWDIVSGATGATLSNNTKYYIKLLFDGSKYVMSYSTDGETYTDTITLTTSTHIVDNKTIYAGASWERGDHYLRGTMYLKDFYIKRNGAVTWRATDQLNYTVVGSPTISSDYVASGFSSSNYLTIGSFPFNTADSWEIRFKITTSNLSGTQFILGTWKNSNSIVVGISNSKLQWWLSSNTGSWSIASDAGSYAVSANTTYYVKAMYANGVYTLLASTDGSTWTTSSSISNASKITGGSVLNVGTAWENSEIYAGSIDLKDFYININGTEVWRAVEVPVSTRVSIDAYDNWTALQNRTYWYKEGNTTDVADLTSDTYEADLKGYLIFSEDANEDLIVKGYTSAYTVTTYNTPDVYSGYSYTVTDSTGASISTFEKTGTLCKAYTIPAMAGLKFVFIPAEDLEDGHVYEAGDIREAYSETNGTPFRQLDESTEDYTYNASTDTLTDENEGELTCIGHVYVEWNDIAE